MISYISVDASKTTFLTSLECPLFGVFRIALCVFRFLFEIWVILKSSHINVFTDRDIRAVWVTFPILAYLDSAFTIGFVTEGGKLRIYQLVISLTYMNFKYLP